MPSFCAVLDCGDKYGGKSVPFHKFPTKNLELLGKWIAFTQRPKEWRPSKWMSVCGLHFRDEDYRSLEQKKLLKKTAVPSVRIINNKPTPSKINECYIESELDAESNECELENSVKPKINCRFCGVSTSNFDSFAGNFEMFGMIQKCLPALIIRQDDNLPKEICQICLKKLENFASFIDKVLERQAALQRQFRIEKGNKANERTLKIKQEPTVRVKQENLEDINVFFPDEVDDGCGEQEHDVSNTEAQIEQKFPFCDFPVLNDQDLINNCDIMEIINLSDPFIDITNCENTIAEEEQQQRDSRLSKQTVLSAHELLQSHLLIEEHNYAYSPEDFKQEWQIKNCYKTEKIEADEYAQDEQMVSCDANDIDRLSTTNFDDNDIDDLTVVAAITNAKTTTTTTTEEQTSTEIERSIKPIVTSVSSIQQSSAFCSIPATPSNTQPQSTSRKKPNIVVLNESIVQSSQAFQLQACSICQLKFFGVDSLTQHYKTTHNPQNTNLNINTNSTVPMVSVPSSNLIVPVSTHNCKIEKDVGLEAKEIEFDSGQIQRTEFNNFPLFNSSNYTTNKRSSKNEIKILDMQQSFLQHQYNYPNLIRFEPTTTQEMPPCNPVDMLQNTQRNFDYQSNEVAFLANKNTTITTIVPLDTALVPSKQIVEKSCSFPDSLTVKYLALKKRYHRLRLKCQSKKPKTANKVSKIRSKRRFPCRMCKLVFRSIFQLLRHKQTTPFHYIKKKRSNFFSTCRGCEKFFCQKIALFNHMRYICQSLPWYKTQLRTFKCRYCRRITFTHWRLYRAHEIKCRQRKVKNSETAKTPISTILNIEEVKSGTVNKLNLIKQNTRQQPKVINTTLNNSSIQTEPYECTICHKVFPSSSSFSQHRITHSDLRSYQCELCKRIFKRRNGLSQHIRGYHMKLKPYECPTCKHCYALKADMKRCKHSVMTKNVKRKCHGKKIFA